MVGYVDGASKVHVGDFHAIRNGQPIADSCQDWSILHGEQSGGSTLLVVSRLMITADPNDRPLYTSGFKKTSLLAAYGPSDSFTAYHMLNRVSCTLLLANASHRINTNISTQQESFGNPCF